jgi:photosystem II stability/assembly factor-like uncharacterized protein
LPLGTSADFRDIWFTDTDRGLIVGGGYQITGGLIGRSDDGGRTWRYTSNLTKRDGMTVSAVHVFDSGRAVVATGTGAIFSTSDGGESWAPVEQSGRPISLSAFFFLDERLGWAAGQGHVLRTDDAGRTWTALAPDVDVSYKSPVRAIQFLDETNGWLVGMHASLMHSVDGGVTWSAVETPIVGNVRPSFWDMFFVDGQFGWVVGEEGTILATRDSGATWTRQTTALKDAHSAPKLERIPQAGGVAVIDAGDRTPGLTLSAIRFVDRNRGWMTGFYANLGRSLILRTEDAGATWVVDADIAGEELRALFVQGRDRLWAIGARVREGPQSIYRRAIPAGPK